MWGSVIGSHCEEVNEIAWYQHKEIHKHTWVCPGRELKSIVHYFLARKDNQVRIKNVKVVRGAEIGNDI